MRRKIILSFAFFSLSLMVVCQEVDTLAKYAFSFSASYTCDFVRNAKGGIKKGNAFLGMVDLSVAVDFEKLGLWKGGEIFMHGLNMHGATPSSDLTGDNQVFSNIEAGNFTSFYELFFKQTFGKVQIGIGQQDLNSDFVCTETGGYFVSSSFGIMPCVSINIPVPIFPINSFGITLHWKMNDKISFHSSIFDGYPGNPQDNPYGMNFKMSRNEGFLNVNELHVDLKKNNQLLNYFRFGTAYHSADFKSYRDPNKISKGNFGIYLIADKTFLNTNKFKLDGFFQGGYFPAESCFIDYYVGGGVKSGSIFSKNDEFGIAVAHSHFNKWAFPSVLMRSETAIEMDYQVVYSVFTVKPVFQYIIYSGNQNSSQNSLLAMIRFIIQFDN